MNDAKDIDLNEDNIKGSSFTASLADTLDKLNGLISKTEVLALDDIPKVTQSIETMKNLFLELKQIELYDDVNIVEDLKTGLETLINDIQSKLDSGFYKGATGEPFTYDKFTPQQIENLKIKGDEGKPFTYDMFTAQQLESLKGVSIKDIKTTNNELVIVDSLNKEYNLGNFTNDYNNLVNLPYLNNGFKYLGSCRSIVDKVKFISLESFSRMLVEFELYTSENGFLAKHNIRFFSISGSTSDSFVVSVDNFSSNSHSLDVEFSVEYNESTKEFDFYFVNKLYTTIKVLYLKSFYSNVQFNNEVLYGR